MLLDSAQILVLHSHELSSQQGSRLLPWWTILIEDALTQERVESISSGTKAIVYQNMSMADIWEVEKSYEHTFEAC
jgi:hypothetical protein